MADDMAAEKSLTEPVRVLNEAFKQMLDADSHPIPEAYRRNSPMEPGETLIPVAKYISREFHELEVEKLWKRVWQMACHEDDIPGVGDYLPYDIANMSFLIVRTGEDSFKAYYNACLHRGRKLREHRGRGASELRCQFHAWTWSLEGRLMQVPCMWDFPGLKREEQSLPEVKVGRWGGFIFINPDPDCEPFEDFIGDLSSQFEVLPYERRYKSAHVAKIIRCNWKIAHESFMESYHVIATHPEGFSGGIQDLLAKYDVFGNYARAIHVPGLVTSGGIDWGDLPDDGKVRVRHPQTGYVYEAADDGLVRVTTPKGKTGLYTKKGAHVEGDVGDVSLHICDWVGGPQLPGVGRMQATMMSTYDAQREALRPIIPSIADKIADVEFQAVYLTLFPNFHPWGSFNQIVYRFRPHGDNHEECIMECMYMSPKPEVGDYPPAPPIHWLTADDDWTDAPELGMLGKVFNQDSANMPFVHQGMKATRRECIRLGEYGETKIRHFHKLLDEWVARP